MLLLRVFCWALIFIIRLRFPPGSSIISISSPFWKGVFPEISHVWHILFVYAIQHPTQHYAQLKIVKRITMKTIWNMLKFTNVSLQRATSSEYKITKKETLVNLFNDISNRLRGYTFNFFELGSYFIFSLRFSPGKPIATIVRNVASCVLAIDELSAARPRILHLQFIHHESVQRDVGLRDNTTKHHNLVSQSHPESSAYISFRCN